MIILKSKGTSEDTYKKHAFKHDWWKSDLRGLNERQILKAYAKQPVCPKCGQVIYRHTGYRENGSAMCNQCGPVKSTITLDQFLSSKLHK